MSFVDKLKSIFGPPQEKNDHNESEGESEKLLEENKPVPVQKRDRNNALERIEKGFSDLITQLEGINNNLQRQADKQEELLGKLEEMPDIFKKFPESAEVQKKLSEQLIETIRDNQEKEQEFMTTLERIPQEAMRQTEAIVDLDRKVGENAHTNTKVAENFSRFNENIDNLNKSTQGNSDSIAQMSKTFASSDRYMKFLVTKQNRKFIWVLSFTIIFSIVVIAILAGIILYISQ